jgi:hypothetical protein
MVVSVYSPSDRTLLVKVAGNVSWIGIRVKKKVNENKHIYAVYTFRTVFWLLD